MTHEFMLTVSPSECTKMRSRLVPGSRKISRNVRRGTRCDGRIFTESELRSEIPARLIGEPLVPIGMPPLQAATVMYLSREVGPGPAGGGWLQIGFVGSAPANQVTGGKFIWKKRLVSGVLPPARAPPAWSMARSRKILVPGPTASLGPVL